jgi:2-(1,2-epoxy-1,2-dihydrophenyl)acetyl-CoA isomerase
MNSKALRVETDASGLAALVFTQGERGNPFDGDFCRAWKAAMLELWDWKALRAVLIRGEGANFSLGGDLKALQAHRAELSKVVQEWTSELHMGLARAWHLPVPIVVQVQGSAMGGAVALLAGCDVVMAGHSARFGSAFARIGFSCDSGSSATLSFRMGPARARRFVMLAEVLSSEQARLCGLVDEVVPDGELPSRALELAKRLAAGPTLAYGQIKRLFLRAGAAQFESQLEDEALTLARLSQSDDAQEGVAAFIERRKPVFKGG